jgi:hypothetical protein
MDSEHLKGLVVSFLDILDDILIRRSPVSTLTHFYQERLNKNERKLLQVFFEKNIERMTKKRQKDLSESGSTNSEESQIPDEFQVILRFFQQKVVVSTHATESRQLPISRKDDFPGVER